MANNWYRTWRYAHSMWYSVSISINFISGHLRIYHAWLTRWKLQFLGKLFSEFDRPCCIILNMDGCLLAFSLHKSKRMPLKRIPSRLPYIFNVKSEMPTKLFILMSLVLSRMVNEFDCSIKHSIFCTLLPFSWHWTSLKMIVFTRKFVKIASDIKWRTHLSGAASTQHIDKNKKIWEMFLFHFYSFYWNAKLTQYRIRLRLIAERQT